MWPRPFTKRPRTDRHTKAVKGRRSFTEHDGVDDESDDVLQDEDGDGGRTLLRDHTSPKADGHLNLDGEEEC